MIRNKKSAGIRLSAGGKMRRPMSVYQDLIRFGK
jgi:hypothetical protein